jgi:predicted peptidase
MIHLKTSCSLALLLALALLTGCSGKHVDWDNTGAPAGAGFHTRQLTHEGKTRNYTVFVPHAYKPGSSYPVLLFLHGALESGSDGKKCVTVGVGPIVSNRAKDFPFFVVFPQSSSDWQSESDMKLALTTLDQVIKDYPGADANRVTLTGLSNGGDGTWAIGARYTERFAALVPMCSGPSYDDAPRLTKLPIWAIHNSVDPFRSSGKVGEMVDRINKAGGNAKFTKYPEMGHDCWNRAYSEGELLAWMQQQKRGAASKASAMVP